MVPFQRRASAGSRRAAVAPERSRRDRDGRMPREQPQQFLSGVAGGAGHRDARLSAPAPRARPGDAALPWR